MESNNLIITKKGFDKCKLFIGNYLSVELDSYGLPSLVVFDDVQYSVVISYARIGIIHSISTFLQKNLFLEKDVSDIISKQIVEEVYDNYKITILKI
jgi:hypothetical protein